MNKVKGFAPLVALLLLLGPVGLACAAGPVSPPPEERCGTCGMYVTPHADKWLAQIQFKDGTTVFFDGPKDLFVFYFDLARHKPGARVEDVAAIYVTEYYSRKQMKIGEVFLVSGSDVHGPMGQELVPVAGRDQVDSFRREHGGQKILQFNGSDLIATPLPQ